VTFDLKRGVPGNLSEKLVSVVFFYREDAKIAKKT
jgi:hypothetical protein